MCVCVDKRQQGFVRLFGGGDHTEWFFYWADMKTEPMGPTIYAGKAWHFRRKEQQKNKKVSVEWWSVNITLWTEECQRSQREILIMTGSNRSGLIGCFDLKAFCHYYCYSMDVILWKMRTWPGAFGVELWLLKHLSWILIRTFLLYGNIIMVCSLLCSTYCWLEVEIMNIDVFSRDGIPSLLRGNTLVLVDSPTVLYRCHWPQSPGKGHQWYFMNCRG